MKKTYHGSCHCKAIRFEADLDLSSGSFKCNCTICTKTRMWGATATPADFRLLSGQDALQDYVPNGNIHNLFCKHCGVRPFGWGLDPQSGERFYGIRVSALDDLDVDPLMNAPIAYFDGRNDDFEKAPAEIRHL